ncbi:hypothetical protein LTR33_015055, partial [Friedmanniomyces endolithicus]
PSATPPHPQHLAQHNLYPTPTQPHPAPSPHRPPSPPHQPQPPLQQQQPPPQHQSPYLTPQYPPSTHQTTPAQATASCGRCRRSRRTCSGWSTTTIGMECLCICTRWTLGRLMRGWVGD